MRFAFLPIAALAFIPATAYCQTTTTCRQIGNVTRCNSQPQGGIDWSLLTPPPSLPMIPNYGYANEEAKARLLAEADARLADATRRNDEEGRRLEKIIGDAVADGRCAEIYEGALRGGFLDTAMKIKALCGDSIHPRP